MLQIQKENNWMLFYIKDRCVDSWSVGSQFDKITTSFGLSAILLLNIEHDSDIEYMVLKFKNYLKEIE